jgi:hypothetical protein
MGGYLPELIPALLFVLVSIGHLSTLGQTAQTSTDAMKPSSDVCALTQDVPRRPSLFVDLSSLSAQGSSLRQVGVEGMACSAPIRCRDRLQEAGHVLEMQL